jgi:hypothetical protein
MNIPYTWNDNHGYVFKWVSYRRHSDMLYDNCLIDDLLLAVTCSPCDRWFSYPGFFAPLCLSPLLLMRGTRVSLDPE